MTKVAAKLVRVDAFFPEGALTEEEAEAVELCGEILRRLKAEKGVPPHVPPKGTPTLGVYRPGGTGLFGGTPVGYLPVSCIPASSSHVEAMYYDREKREYMYKLADGRVVRMGEYK